MSDYPIRFHGTLLRARPSGALFWPERGWLIVADLHLGKSERMARRGGALLPPYECEATLDRLETEVAALDPACIVSLGDAFDDDAAGHALDDTICTRIDALARGRRLVWVAGNHDPGGAVMRLPGQWQQELHEGLVFRHIAGQGPDVSGHFHPCIRLAGQRRKAFAIGDAHLILPAFGTYTGGLDLSEPSLHALVPEGLAVVCGAKALPLPIGVSSAGRRWSGRRMA
ncbi:MAG: ligase-associated DNA damage response endonuclease PdeM [Paracoccus sp. (in: a-proteobacteria)]|nr:ligase-associated DNA damage response endonuclease PdeM [Paracoccus sp. (in: a-proteobacteria)]